MNPSPPRHIIVSRTDSPGEVLLTLPVFQTLRKAFPQARLTILIGPTGKAIVQGHPAIDAIEVVEKGEGILKLAGRLKKLGADTLLIMNPWSKLVLAAWLAKIPVRIGWRERWHVFFQTQTIQLNRWVSDRPEVEYNFEMLKPLGITEFAKKVDFYINGVDQDLAVNFLRQKGIPPGTPYVVVHPIGQRQVLNWKAERYAQMLTHLCQVKGLKVVVTGRPEDAPLLNEVTGFLFSLPAEQKPVVLMGELGLKPLAAVYQGALCFLSGACGPMHLAAAVGTPTVTLFSPAPDATPVKWGPWGNESNILIPENPDCSGCQVGYCKKHDPMDALTIPQVFHVMEKYIRKALSL